MTCALWLLGSEVSLPLPPPHAAKTEAGTRAATTALANFIERAARKDPNGGMPVMLLSGSVDLEIDLASQVGADARLPKPFRIDEFRRTLGSLLAA
jgi:hypothetical protein